MASFVSFSPGRRAGTTLCRLRLTLGGKGLTARFTYSYSRTEDYAPEDYGSGGFMPSNPLNANGERAPEGYRNVARLFYIYDIPLLRGQHSWMARLLGNWQISGSVLATTGDPFTVLLAGLQF